MSEPLWRDPLLDVSAAAEADRRAREKLRRVVVAACDFGISELKVSAAAGISRTTLRRWRMGREVARMMEAKNVSGS